MAEGVVESGRSLAGLAYEPPVGFGLDLPALAIRLTAGCGLVAGSCAMQSRPEAHGLPATRPLSR